jgi:DNA end-binding protein Ku
MGSGTISFGLVSIPVKLFSTIDSTKAIRFNYLSKDGSRLKQQYIRASDGEIVEREDRVQGYEFAKGQYVLFIYIEKVYYLGPDKGAARSYHLLREALAKTGRAALARYAARGKSYLVLIRPMGEGLVLEQLKHREELRPFEDVPLDVCDIEDSELELAIQIIEQRTNEAFEPDRYSDEIRSRIMELIEQKVEGRDISVPPEEAPEAKIIDLMEALKASVDEVPSRGRSTPTRAKATPRKAGAKAPRKPRSATKKTPTAKKTSKRKTG